MGQFSWLDCVTGKQIVDDKEKDVYLLVPKQFGGGHIKETCYDGYGRFGGHDVYDLVVDWNKDFISEVLKMKDNWNCPISALDVLDFIRVKDDLEPIQEKRWLGIILACYDEDNFRLRFPIKITYDEDAVYEECRPSPADPNQGWEMEDDYDDDDEWY